MSLDYSRDGRLLGAGCSDGTVRLFDMAGGGRSQVMAWTVSHGGGCTSLRFADDGKSLMTLSGDGSLQVVPVAHAVTALRSTPFLCSGWKLPCHLRHGLCYPLPLLCQSI